MNKNLIIYHHLGLGDHLICNGAVRGIVAEDLSKNYRLLCYHHNMITVKYLYRDIPNLQVIGVGSDNEADIISQGHPTRRMMIFENHSVDLTNLTFSEAFYSLAGVDFTNRWDNFHIERDMEKEKELFDSYGLVEGEYIFVHTDPKRGLSIKMNHVRSDMKIIIPDRRCDNLLMYGYILENAKEFHGFDSTFMILADSLIKIPEKLYYHKYVRFHNNLLGQMKVKNKWEVIN